MTVQRFVDGYVYSVHIIFDTEIISIADLKPTIGILISNQTLSFCLNLYPLNGRVLDISWISATLGDHAQGSPSKDVSRAD